MNIIETAREFEKQVLPRGGWQDSSVLATSTVARCNEYVVAMGYEPVPVTIEPQVMLLGMVREGVFRGPFAVPSMIKTVRDGQSGWNHPAAFKALCAEHQARPFRPHSFWLGFVLPENTSSKTYHLILNTYGEGDQLRRVQRRQAAKNLLSVLSKVKGCAVIETTERVFDARTGEHLTPHERSLDISVPWDDERPQLVR